jgi:hypothetical protein
MVFLGPRGYEVEQIHDITFVLERDCFTDTLGPILAGDEMTANQDEVWGR